MASTPEVTAVDFGTTTGSWWTASPIEKGRPTSTPPLAVYTPVALTYLRFSRRLRANCIWLCSVPASWFKMCTCRGAVVLTSDLMSGGLNLAYARIKTRGGDAKQTLGILLTGSRQWMPKIAYVFDEDVDICSDERGSELLPGPITLR
jgi:hypothetical protein